MYKVTAPVHSKDLQESLNLIKGEVIQILDSGANYWLIVYKEKKSARKPLETPRTGD